MTLKLNQVIALEKGTKGVANGAINKLYHTVQKTPLFSGQERVYRPKDDEGEQFPPEPVKLQLRVENVLRDLIPDITRWWDLTLTKDAGNQRANADIVIDGETLVPNVPVTTLLFLEKQLTDLGTLIGKLPVLDPSENWDINQDGDWATEATLTNKTKKVPRTFVKAAATDKHPAQTEVFMEDTVIGTWATVKISGAIPEAKRRELLSKVEKLKAAVKLAREQANMNEVEDQRMGAVLFQYLGW